MRPVRNLVIDLGGVLYAIDPHRSLERFLNLGGERTEVDPLAWFTRHSSAFDDLEAGKLTPGEFRDYLRQHGGISASDAEIDAAWNALLIGVIPGRATDLETLKGSYRLILLSNTNLIHQKALKSECVELFAQFEHLFFSYEMGLRKPDPEIYRVAVSAMGMEPAESLFLDDNMGNVDGAIAAGLQGHHLPAHSNPHWEGLVQKLKAGFV